MSTFSLAKHWVAAVKSMSDEQRRFLSAELQLGSREPATADEIGIRLCEAVLHARFTHQVSRWSPS